MCVEVDEDVFAALVYSFLGCPHVGLDGLGFDDGNIPMFCGAVDGIDDDISVRLHGRSLVLYGQSQGPQYLVPRRQHPTHNQCTLKPEEPVKPSNAVPATPFGA
ncbi:hypothetical protein [Corynebacterium diphtheriae]|uniref:hypothetical protein n=1 Tax=Corynebacterium diphtheriae TaxID=1717 RepID=UPI001F533BEB|nr:hypothetical protein [Corynebacterium diphtheriae]